MLHLYDDREFSAQGLKVLLRKRQRLKLQPQHLDKIRLILTRLDAATAPGDMNVPGYGLHPLTGELKAFWAIKVDKNYHIIFRFQGENVHDVDYLDYH